MKISLHEFIKTGSLGGVHPGISRIETGRLLGMPNGWSELHTANGQPAIWKYGGVEVHFVNDTVRMIFIDAFDHHYHGIDFWILHAGLTLPDAQAALARSGIEYRQEEVLLLEGRIALVTGSGVTLHFGQENGEPIPVLCAVFKDTP